MINVLKAQIEKKGSMKYQMPSFGIEMKNIRMSLTEMLKNNKHSNRS